MATEITHSIQQLTDLTASEISEFAGISTINTYESNSNFIKTGKIPKKFGFVLSGLFRYVYVSEDGKEFTKVFMPEKSFVSSYSAMISKTPSHFSIEAIENSEVLEISYDKWRKLIRHNPNWKDLLIKLLEKGYAAKEKREREFLLLDAENRYKIFLEEYKNIESRVKQHMIASYLGITPIALSRIRKKMNR